MLARGFGFFFSDANLLSEHSLLISLFVSCPRPPLSSIGLVHTVVWTTSVGAYTTYNSLILLNQCRLCASALPALALPPPPPPAHYDRTVGTQAACLMAAQERHPSFCVSGLDELSPETIQQALSNPTGPAADQMRNVLAKLNDELGDPVGVLCCVALCCVVLCCAVLCCVVLCCVVLCCVVLCCVVLCCVVLCCVVLCCVVLCCVVLCCVVLCCVVLCCVVLCCVVLCCVVLCCVVLCCVVLCCVVLHLGDFRALVCTCHNYPMDLTPAATAVPDPTPAHPPRASG